MSQTKSTGGAPERSGGLARAPDARLDEARGLAAAIDLDIVHNGLVPVSKPQPATLIGSGKIGELAEIVMDEQIEVVVVDHPLTPVQQRNLEKALDAKVLDRTGLILEIFGERARTKEGVLQVELAHLNYQRGRLVRSWTHLERQRGGAGFLGGPGETQIEADRRILRDRIVRVKRQLETVRRTRELHRAKRKKVPYPVVAIVGYTNAGKSTLFNRLTGAEVMAKDMLFATLDPTLRRLKLPHGTTVILSDTVGFISDLPTHLVAAFRATLEEVVEADLVIHLRDMSDPDFAAQADDVNRILADLGIDATDEERVLEVWNKADLAAAGEAGPALPRRSGAGAPITISARTGAGIERLKERIERLISGGLETLTVRLEVGEAGMADWLYRNSEVTGREDRDDGGLDLRIRATQAVRGSIEKRLGRRVAG
ncbi:MAG: GTPase HflX [Rhizobiaceae bacterium]